ncbi:hypothetical protein WG904_18220 [Pedobacter sp. Du54]|uniref:hypothetical protein n=1 Tax=Pedobacter anseongensis TaxID=3133439 RepID=UPI0030B76CB4
MVEVFKTNVNDALDAQLILNHIHENFSNYQANFALDDCDKILRINCLDGFVAAVDIIAIVAAHGFDASILAHDFQPRSFIF